jgi:hypothetical protein
MAFMNAGKQQRLEPGSSPHLAEVIDAADRRIKDYLSRQHLSLWHPISTAPNNHDLELKVLDSASSVVLPFACRRTNSGKWMNAELKAGIDIRRRNGARCKKQERASRSSALEAALLTIMSGGGAIHE